MRRTSLLAAFAIVFAPATATAQVSLLAGGGLSSPIGAFGDQAESGWHALAGLQLGIPVIPVALRADATYQSFGQPTSAPSTSMLTGALSAVISLPGVGLVPYLAGGFGAYRVRVDQSGVDAESERGIHGAFGVNIGALGFGGFGEVRLVSVSQSGDDARFVTATLGLRL